MQRRYQKEIKRQGFKIKVVEKAGVAIKKLLQRSDPFNSRKCERRDFPVCRGDGKGQCDRQSVTYDIKYAECNDIYIGETSRSAYTRGKEHMKSLAKKEERSALWKHCNMKHNSKMQKFEMNVTGSYSNDAMLRQISERGRIDQIPECSLMNSKNEWNFFRVPRAVVARDHVKYIGLHDIGQHADYLSASVRAQKSPNTKSTRRHRAQDFHIGFSEASKK